jgi:hypothetical protein
VERGSKFKQLFEFLWISFSLSFFFLFIFSAIFKVILDIEAKGGSTGYKNDPKLFRLKLEEFAVEVSVCEHCFSNTLLLHYDGSLPSIL